MDSDDKNKVNCEIITKVSAAIHLSQHSTLALLVPTHIFHVQRGIINDVRGVLTFSFISK